ncbi:MAG: YfhO family protein [Lachnospiraceae bacterium]|nr:YfhO family protein [Lachnospiraceae bacterium]
MTNNFKLKLNRMTMLVLAAAIGATCLIVFREYIFGSRILAFYDIGSDTAEQYLSLYAMLIRKLQTGDLTLWGADNGFGINLNMLNMTNPALMLLYITGAVIGTERMPYLLVYLYMLEIMAAGICCYLYLSVFRLDERAKAMASYMYCFSGFIMVWGQHYQFAIVPTLLILEMLFIERCIRCPRKWKGLTVMTAFLVFNSMYIAYMCLIFCAFYVCVRVLLRRLRSFKRYFWDAFHLAWVMGLGVGIGFITLLPAVAAILSVSSRLATQEPLFQRLFVTYPKVYYSTLVARLFGSTFKGISDYRGFFNYYEDPCLYFSILFALLLVQYIFLIPSISGNVASLAESSGKKFRVNKIKLIVTQYVLLVFVAACLCWAGTGTIFNGFTAFFSRYMFIVMPYFALIAAFAMHEIIRLKKVSYIALAIGVLVTGRFCLVYFIDPGMSNPKYAALAHLVCCILMGAVLVAFSIDALDAFRRYIILGLIFLLFVDVTADNIANFRGRDTVQKGGKYFEELYDVDTKDALRWIRENDGQWFRTEKGYGATLATDSMVQGYHPVSAYNSTQNANIQNYVAMYWDDLLFADINHYIYVLGCANTDQSKLCGIKYVLSRNEELDIPGTEMAAKFGDVVVYRFADVENICSYYPYDEVSGTFGTASDGLTDTVTVNYEQRDDLAKISMLDSGKDDRIDGEVTVFQKGVLFIAIPYENGWSVYVDGKKAAMRKANEGFIAVDLEAGIHSVTLKYVCPGLIKGIIITIFSIALMVAFYYLEKRRDKKTGGADDWSRMTPAELLLCTFIVLILRKVNPEKAEVWQKKLEPPAKKGRKRKRRRRKRAKEPS